MKRKKTNKFFQALPGGIMLILLFVTGSPAAGNIDSTNKWAWGATLGWVNFNAPEGGVTVYRDHLEGYAWGENIGWIRLGACINGRPCTYANTSAADYGVNNDGIGNLSGYAWGTNVGWVNFKPANGRVTIHPLTGAFDGYAWGENVGWIHFKGGAGATAYSLITFWHNSVYLPLVIKKSP